MMKVATRTYAMPAGAADAWAKLPEKEQADFRDLKVGETASFTVPDKSDPPHTYQLTLVDYVELSGEEYDRWIEQQYFRLGRVGLRGKMNSTTMPDPTLSNHRRREQRWKRDAGKHVRTMRFRGLPLTLTYRNGTPMWRLGSAHVEAGAAEIVIKHPSVIGVGDALFRDVRSQTYRFSED
jgi:hypothetical protein